MSNNNTLMRWIKRHEAIIAASVTMGTLMAVAILRGLTPTL